MRNKNMSSSGTGSDISAQEAVDLLHKLMTEFIKVQAHFKCPACRVNSAVCGVVRFSSEDNTFWIQEPERDLSGPVLSFDPSLSVIRKYGDERSMTDGGESPFGVHFTSALTFAFADGSTLGLWAIKEE